MSLLKHLRYVPRHFALILAVTLATVTVATTLAWGPSRDTYTVEKPADHVVFNSITNNPVDGDERNFSRAKDGTTWTDNVKVQPGREYKVRLVVHNNAADNLNLKAKNTRASASVPTTTGKSVSISNFVSADNAQPQRVWDDVSFTSDRNFNLVYVPGSARIYNNGYAAGGSGKALPDSIVTSAGAVLGYKEAGDGIIPGCFKYLSYVEYTVKPQFAPAPNFEVQKTVRVNGATDKTFKESVDVKPGDKVDYQIHFKNTGEAQLKDVVIRDQLPANMTYVAGSTWLANDGGARQVANGVTASGINIGGYLTGGGAYVKFTAQVAANDKLTVCGKNTLINTASANTTAGSKSDTANVTVTKTCKPPEDIRVCLLSEKKIVTIKASEFDKKKHSKNLSDCDEASLKVCLIASDTIVTIKASEFDNKKHSKNIADCKKVQVCDEETGDIITVPASEADDYLPVGDAACADKPEVETPAVIASTGPEALLGGLFGSSALGYGAYSFASSRRTLINKLLGR